MTYKGSVHIEGEFQKSSRNKIATLKHKSYGNIVFLSHFLKLQV